MLGKYMASLDIVLPFLHDCLENYVMDALKVKGSAQSNPAAQAVQASLGDLCVPITSHQYLL